MFCASIGFFLWHFLCAAEHLIDTFVHLANDIICTNPVCGLCWGGWGKGVMGLCVKNKAQTENSDSYTMYKVCGVCFYMDQKKFHRPGVLRFSIWILQHFPTQSWQQGQGNKATTKQLWFTCLFVISFCSCVLELSVWAISFCSCV